jgi:hypothetical protein
LTEADDPAADASGEGGAHPGAFEVASGLFSLGSGGAHFGPGLGQGGGGDIGLGGGEEVVPQHFGVALLVEFGEPEGGLGRGEAGIRQGHGGAEVGILEFHEHGAGLEEGAVLEFRGHAHHPRRDLRAEGDFLAGTNHALGTDLDVVIRASEFNHAGSNGGSLASGRRGCDGLPGQPQEPESSQAKESDRSKDGAPSPSSPWMACVGRWVLVGVPLHDPLETREPVVS